MPLIPRQELLWREIPVIRSPACVVVLALPLVTLTVELTVPDLMPIHILVMVEPAPTSRQILVAYKFFSKYGAAYLTLVVNPAVYCSVVCHLNRMPWTRMPDIRSKQFVRLHGFSHETRAISVKWSRFQPLKSGIKTVAVNCPSVSKC